jgi:hypothetical protein
VKRSDDAFAKRLREAGAALTPAASDALHARLMADVRRERAAASSAPAGDSMAPRRLRIVGAAAAVGAVGFGIWVTTTRPPAAIPVQPPVQVAQLPPVPSIEAVVVETVQPVRQKLHEARFAYLDRDAKRLARFLIHAVPGVPADGNEAALR